MTEGDYGVFGKSGIADIREKNSPYFLARILGCEARNFGKCGYTLTSYLANYETNRVKVEGSDIILVMLGTNGGLKPNDPTALCPEFTAENEKIMQPNDGLHFGEAGYEALANYIAAELKKLCPNL